MPGQGIGGFDAGGGGGNTNNRRISNRADDFGISTNPVSLNEILMGGLTVAGTGSDQTVRPYISTTNVKSIRHEARNDYQYKAFMSLDGVFRAVSQSGDGGLPRYVFPITVSGDVKNNRFDISGFVLYTGFQDPSGTYGYTGPATMHPPHMVYNSGNVTGVSGSISPSFTIYSQVIGLNYLNPLVHPTFDHYGSHSGHDIDIVGKGSGLPSAGSHLSTYVERLNNRNPYTLDTRHISFRGPLIMHGWGYDTNGKPVPNQVDRESAASGGIFSPTGLTNSFLSGWLEKPHTWPVAPIDLRLDRKRGVWVSPPSYSLICAKVDGTGIPALGSGTARMLAGPPLWDNSGNIIQYSGSGGTQIGPTFVMHEVLNSALSSGDRVLAYYDSSTDEYFALGGPGGGGGGSWIRFKLTTTLTKSSEAASGHILEKWGGGPDSVDDIVPVYNLQEASVGYAWDGGVNTVGYATYDSENKQGWRIISLACSTVPIVTEDCSNCKTGTTPRSFRISVAGISDSVCTECPERLEGTYFVSQSGNNSCVYRAEYNNSGCSPIIMRLDLLPDGSNTQANVQLFYYNSGAAAVHSISWAGNLGATTGLDCRLIDQTLAYSTQVGGSCDGVGSSARITAT